MNPRKEAVLSSSKLSLSKESLCREHTQVRNYPTARAKKDCSRGVERNCSGFLEKWPFPSCTHTQQSNYFFPIKGLGKEKEKGVLGLLLMSF